MQDFPLSKKIADKKDSTAPESWVDVWSGLPGTGTHRDPPQKRDDGHHNLYRCRYRGRLTGPYTQPK